MRWLLAAASRQPHAPHVTGRGCRRGHRMKIQDLHARSVQHLHLLASILPWSLLGFPSSASCWANANTHAIYPGWAPPCTRVGTYDTGAGPAGACARPDAGRAARGRHDWLVNDQAAWSPAVPAGRRGGAGRGKAGRGGAGQAAVAGCVGLTPGKEGHALLASVLHVHGHMVIGVDYGPMCARYESVRADMTACVYGGGGCGAPCPCWHWHTGDLQGKLQGELCAPAHVR
jgi:hypothetical protein